ncbi:MAG: leucine-rich repeat domain-containing protein [Lachnospiraceae bacterium]|nr:leucine-rich repeat domain-containing protein [Lachnospiraceae bacterium]
MRLKISGFVLALLALILLLPCWNLYAGDSPSWHSGGPASDYYDYFEENSVWYIITQKPQGTKHGKVYAAGARDKVTKLVIPGSLKHDKKDYDVLGINDWAFYDHPGIKSLEIKEGMTYIGDSAFCQCNNLTTVKLADSINEIGNFAFSDCHSLKTINIPNGLKKIPMLMLANCTSLKKIELGKKVTSIGESAFAGCENMKNVKFDKALKEIGNSAFNYCKSLSSVKFTSNITKIGERAFSYCQSLKKVTLPKKLKVVSAECFSWCDKLKTVKLPKGIKEIGQGAFEFCSALETVNGTNSKLESIGGNAFGQCEKLNSINISNVKEIGEGAFYHTSLVKIDFGENLEMMGRSAFSETKLQNVTIPGSLKEIPTGAFSSSTELSSVTLKKGVERISDAAFYNCKKLMDFNYPDTVHYVSYNSLEHTPWYELALGKFYVTDMSGNGYYSYSHNGADDYSKCPEYLCINDVCIWIDKYERFINSYGVWASKVKEELVFPDVKVISCSVGSENELKKIVIPEGVAELDGSISMDSTGATDPIEIVLPSTLKKLTAIIKGRRFKSIVLPENLEVLGGQRYGGPSGFSGAGSLESVKFTGNKVKKIGIACFANTTSLKEIYLPEGIEELDTRAFADSGLESIILPYTLKKIGVSAFANTKLEKIELPDDLNEIGQYAFSNTKLFLVTTPGNIKYGDGSCVLPRDIKFVDWGAFDNTELNKFILPDDFEIECKITDDMNAIIYVKKNSKAHKALKQFLNGYTDMWKIKFK